ncbi:MAG TPA: hypothetical protein PKZ53_17350 [Acidobacteriota bacterium]|nr:hypothetical protein [Acidobacteriota bacterium]
MTLRIQRSTEADWVVFTLSGRISAEQIETLHSLFALEVAAGFILDLIEVKLVDREAVKILARWEATGIRLRNCPPFIREWIARERACF